MIRPRHTYCGGERVSLRKIRPSRTTSTMLAPAHTALATPAGIARVAYENATKPSRSSSTPATRIAGRSKPCARPSSTTPVTSATTVTNRNPMPGRGPDPHHGYGGHGYGGTVVGEGKSKPPGPDQV